MSSYHVPVLLHESVDGLNMNPDGVYVDVTFGGGGHSREILNRLSSKGKLIAFDQDGDTKQNLFLDDKRFEFVPQNFEYLKNYCRLLGYQQVDGILADLGVSSHQFDEAHRGFSIRFDAELDMRMNCSGGQLTAKDIINTYSESDLHKIFGIYGEVKNAKTVAKTIVTARLNSPISHVEQLKGILFKLAPRAKQNQYFAQIFQALRITVNRELEVLQQFLEQSAQILKPNGRLVVISYHSLEDRLVKNFVLKGKFHGEAERDLYGNVLTPLVQVSRGAIVASEIEIQRNSRARSAKLRIAEKRN